MRIQDLNSKFMLFKSCTTSWTDNQRPPLTWTIQFLCSLYFIGRCNINTDVENRCNYTFQRIYFNEKKLMWTLFTWLDDKLLRHFAVCPSAESSNYIPLACCKNNKKSLLRSISSILSCKIQQELMTTAATMGQCL